MSLSRLHIRFFQREISFDKILSCFRNGASRWRRKLCRNSLAPREESTERMCPSMKFRIRKMILKLQILSVPSLRSHEPSQEERQVGERSASGWIAFFYFAKKNTLNKIQRIRPTKKMGRYCTAFMNVKISKADGYNCRFLKNGVFFFIFPRKFGFPILQEIFLRYSLKFDDSEGRAAIQKLRNF